MRPRHVLTVVLALLCASQATALDLTRDGKPVAQIVVAKNATAAERFAAADFQSIVASISGAKLSIASEISGQGGAWVLIGEAAVRLAGENVLAAAGLDNIRDDGFALKTVDDRGRSYLLLLGREPRGTLYAVYSFLETTLNCGFFSDGDSFPNRPTLSVSDQDLQGNPAFPLRACWVSTRFYGPKRFHPSLWDADDWRRFLGWMARKKLNCLAMEFSGDTRAWGEAFDKAFPEAKRFKRETIPPPDRPPVPGPTANLGWGLHPSYTTALWKDVFGYARGTLGLQVAYILHVGEFETPLKLALPNQRWLPATAAHFVGVAGATPALSVADPKFRELQTRLWKSILATYGTDHLYVLHCHSHRNAPGGEAAANPVTVGVDILKSIDPKARILLVADDNHIWGSTQELKTEFLRKANTDVEILYTQVAFPGDALHRATDRFAGHGFHYASRWGEAGADLLEYCFDPLRTQSYHMGLTPKPKALGYFHWAELRGSNPLMDSLAAEYAWTGRNTWRSEGGSNNPGTRRYLMKRFPDTPWWPKAEAYKQALRGVPSADVGLNYRAYIRWTDERVRGTGPARAAVALSLTALAAKDAPAQGSFSELGLVQVGRIYLHQYITERYADLVRLVRETKQAAKSNTYTADAKRRAIARLKELDEQLRGAHTALTRIIATRPDMCLDDAILEATATKGANKNLARAIREHQSGVFSDADCLVDSIEYHQQVKRPQIGHFLKYVQAEVNAPTPKPIPGWQEFFLHGTSEFIHNSKPVPYAKKAEKAKASAILAEFLQSTQ